MPVVVVESPAKAKTINQYLGPNYKVLASYGHVRDLPGKDGSVDTENDFEMLWEVDGKAQKHLRAIADALKTDGELILATDPDREGEAISWHLLEALRKRRAVKKDTPVGRVVFNAVTHSAVTEAMSNPRDIDMELVHAYLARRALDYLVGFNLSPVLWRKLPGAKSAGRVQSVSLRLIVQREMEIEAFRAQEYWSVRAALQTPAGEAYEARLTTLDGRKLERHDLDDAQKATDAAKAVALSPLAVVSVEARPGTRNPAPPFMTSTLQQEASRKFGFGARQTMSTAQRLYEAGHITYMRTDGIDMAPEAVMAARSAIEDRYGARYVPSSPRMYKNKAKNAQEAHECIRPTEMNRDPSKVQGLEHDQKRLYDLIWKRTIASQMEAAKLERTVVELKSADGRAGLRATGQVIVFDGFLKVYAESRDETSEAESGDDRRLPVIRDGEPAKLVAGGLSADFSKALADEAGAGMTSADPDGLRRAAKAIAAADDAVLAEQHFTQPPPRYTEATLVKRMEELGIGRPSTYASIVTTIQDRGYVRKERNRLAPEDKGRLVTAFLENFFRKYVNYDFTANLEEELDQVSAGRADWKELLSAFWRDFSHAVDETKELRITEVIDKINEVLEPHLFPPLDDGTDPRLCPNCGAGRLSMRTSRAGGAFIGCSCYPECRYTRSLAGEMEGGDVAGPDGKLLGHDGEDAITLRTGRFGPYVQRGELDPESKEKPKRASVPKGAALEDLDLSRALLYLSLPREVGQHPEGGSIVAASGRFGPYVMREVPPAEEGGKPSKIYASLKDPDDVYTIGMNRAVELIAQKAAGRGGRAAATPLRELGEHPDGGPVNVMEGRYGPYVKWAKVNATLPKDLGPDAVTFEQALELIANKAPKRKASKKKVAKKKASKKKAKKKVVKKKAPAKSAADQT